MPHAVVTVVDHGCERPRAASVMPPAAVEPGRLGPIDLPFRPFRSAPQLPPATTSCAAFNSASKALTVNESRGGIRQAQHIGNKRLPCPYI